MKLAARVIIALAAFVGAASHATTVSLSPPTNLSDHWWNPVESGWGLSLVQHDERLLFGALFAYDPSGRAQWFVMPDMRRGEGVAPSYSGPLYSANGSPLGTNFDPAATRLQQRGEARVTPLLDGTASLRYSVDGTTVEKVVRRMDMMTLPLEGDYAVRFASSAASSCGAVSRPDPEIWRIRRVAEGHAISRTPIGDWPDAYQPMQVRQHGSALIASFAETQSPVRGTWSVVLDSVAGNSFTGKLSFVEDAPAGGCVLQGNVSGARGFPTYELPGWLTDHWFDPSQPGWGLSIYQGSFGLFGVVFLYSADARDAQGLGLAQWYVMPEMRPIPFEQDPGSPPPPPNGYRGTVYSMQGTPLSQPFDATATRGVAVGEATFLTNYADSTTLTYRIGDHTVTRPLRRFETAALPIAGQYRVDMNSNVTSCGQRGVATSETWEIEGAADAGFFLSRTNAAGAAIGTRVPVEVTQRGKIAQLRFSSPQQGIANNWSVTFEHAGAGGVGGVYVRQGAENSCYENGTFAGARVPGP
ncbi:MAG TPA: hypothetical protein VEC19_11775 [Usitatibacter sp.]|nr:hypothetical protein [Usitatibacter sp.]